MYGEEQEVTSDEVNEKRLAGFLFGTLNTYLVYEYFIIKGIKFKARSLCLAKSRVIIKATRSSYSRNSRHNLRPHVITDSTFCRFRQIRYTVVSN